MTSQKTWTYRKLSSDDKKSAKILGKDRTPYYNNNWYVKTPKFVFEIIPNINLNEGSLKFITSVLSGHPHFVQIFA